MAVGITVIKETWETLFVQVQLTGLTPGVKYDLMRLSYRHVSYDDLGNPVYQRALPDRKAYWSAVAHRVGWTAPAATVNVVDYEAPLNAVKYFIVPSSSVGPFEYTNWAVPYPLSRGALSADYVHFNNDIAQQGPGHILVRSTHDLQKFVQACVVEMDELKYTARGTELQVMGSQYPVYVADTREARRGSVVLRVNDLGEYNDLREIVFPSTGAIWPVIFNNAASPPMLLDDMKVVPLDVSVEQASKGDANLRFVRIDYVEIAAAGPILKRTGDNDTYVNHPKANFSISDTTPARKQWVTLTDTSTGQFDSWDWTIRNAGSNVVSKFYTKGPHKVWWGSRGTKYVKLRVYGAEIDGLGHTAGAAVITKTVVVH
jgi:hypothetical protein